MKKIVVVILLVIVVVGVGAWAVSALNKSPQIFERSVAGRYHEKDRIAAPESLKKSSAGPVVGIRDNYNTFAWLGIPYAQPPVADLRWRAPVGLPAWQDPLQATNYGAACVQFWNLVAEEPGESGDVVGSEDCLTLNIWAPQKIDRALPVMVWIHGGGNDSGTSKSYQAHHLAGTKDVVVVTINYRLGLLGWFSHEAIRATSDNLADASGNYGTLDIIQALTWVQENIKTFGGDPDNVTIFGESAGGRNVFSLIASPLAKGLFHKAISQSGTIETTPRILAEPYPDEAPRRTLSGLRNSSSSIIEKVAKTLHPKMSQAELRTHIDQTEPATIMQRMRDTSAEKLMQLATQEYPEPDEIKVANVIQDGHVIPLQNTYSLLNQGTGYNSVPLILGTTRDEQKLFMIRNPKYVDYRFGFLPRIKDPVQYELVSELVSEMWKAGSVDEPASAIFNNQGAPVFAYRFDWDDLSSYFFADVKTIVGAAHASELNFVFGDFEGGVPYHFTYTKANADGRRDLALSMLDYWAAFAHSGNPRRGLTGEQSNWTAWQPSGKNVMLLDEDGDGGVRMAEVNNRVQDIKNKIFADPRLASHEARCQAYAGLMLHGYQLDNFYRQSEYDDLGCDEFPAGTFRER